MWDVTYVDTFDPSYVTMVSDGPGCIANRKGKYASIGVAHQLVPIGIETTGVFGSEADYFLHELSVRLNRVW